MKKQLLISGLIVGSYVLFVIFFAPIVRIPVTSTSTSVSGNDFSVREQIDVTIVRSFWSFLKTVGIESWMLHSLFLLVLIMANLSLALYIKMAKRW